MAARQRQVEGVVLSFWAGKSVLLTGHTGFKGSWMSLWLLRLGVRLTGYALEPATEPALFTQLGLDKEFDSRIGDIRDGQKIGALIKEVQPDIVFHFAAQPLVLASYEDPVGTFATNVMGTAHVLNALRTAAQPCAAVMITTDKVYENLNWEQRYRESDMLGGHDPYSASKAASEIAIASWRRSFLAGSDVRTASARAGNVIGQGDWADFRIVPDLVRSLLAGEPLAVRNPNSVRPWQHVLEPLGGYLSLAQALSTSQDPRFQDAFNFGPAPNADRSVRELVEEALTAWPGETYGWKDTSSPDARHEANYLALSVDRARARLGWSPRWDFRRTVKETMAGYRAAAHASEKELRALMLETIARYEVRRPAGGAAAMLTCRHCGTGLHRVFVDLGHQPPSNAYLPPERLGAPEVTFPLKAYVCEECWLVQIPAHAAADALFTADYAYFSSVSKSWVAHAQAYVEAMIERFGLGPKSFVDRGRLERRLSLAVRGGPRHPLPWHRTDGVNGGCRPRERDRDRRVVSRRGVGPRHCGRNIAKRIS